MIRDLDTVIDNCTTDAVMATTDQVWFFLDDEREPPAQLDRHWSIFRTGESMIAHIARFGLPDGISFDHDLGEGIMSGHDVIKELVEMALDGNLPYTTELQYDVHSQNPVGAKNIHAAMNDLMKIITGALN